MIDDIKCPVCGSKTILRTAKNGPNAGKKFYVCDRYPECKGRVEYTHDDQQEEYVEEEFTDKDKPTKKTGEKLLVVLAVVAVIAVTITCLIKFNVISISSGNESGNTVIPATTYHSPTLQDVELLSYEYFNINGSCCSIPARCGRPSVIKGTINNKTSYTISYVELQVKWCVWDTINATCDEYLHTSYGYIYNLGPNQVQEFTAPEDGYCGSEGGYTIQISDVK